MVSGLASPPPGLGLGGLSLPPPPAGLGSGLKAVGGNIVKLATGGIAKGVGLGVGAVALDLLFPQKTAVADLSALPKDLYNQGTGTEIQEEEIGDPPFLGGQVVTAAYRFKVRYEWWNGGNYAYDKVSNEKTAIGRMIGPEVTIYSYRWQSLEVKVQSSNGNIGGVFIDSTSYSGQEIKNARFEYLYRTDGTSQEDDRTEGGDPPGETIKVGIRSVSGISGNIGDWSPPAPPWTGGYSGPVSPPNNTRDPISPPPSVTGGNIGVGGTGVIGGSDNNTGSISSGGSSGTGTSGVGTSGVAGGAGGVTPGGGIVGGGVVGGGTTTQSPGTVSTGGTATGTGIGTNAPSETAVSSPTNTGNNTASTPVGIPILNPSGQIVGTATTGTGDVLEPGIKPFPPGTGINEEKPGEIIKPETTTKPLTNTPKPPPEEEEEKKPEERIIPIPFNFDFDNCCAETQKAIDDLANDLECVIEKICTDPEPETLEFLLITVVTDPKGQKVFNPSTFGAFEDVVIAGYVRWVVQGETVGPEMEVRRRSQVYLVPEWAEGWQSYPIHGAQFTEQLIYVTQGESP